MPKIVKEDRCERHNFPIYTMDDGTINYHCPICNPEIIPGKERINRILNYGAHNAETGGFCDSRTLELLKKNCTISVNCPPKEENNFYNDHMDAAGYDCDSTYVYPCKDSQKWGYSANIEFNKTPEMKFNDSFKVKIRGSRHCIYSIEFMGFLLHNGMKVGKNVEK